jgi:metaxin
LLKVSTKAMVSSWLYEATMYELWIATGGGIAHEIYFSDLPWPIGKILHWKKNYDVKKLLGVTKLNCEEREAEVIHLHPQPPPKKKKKKKKNLL